MIIIEFGAFWFEHDLRITQQREFCLRKVRPLGTFRVPADVITGIREPALKLAAHEAIHALDLDNCNMQQLHSSEEDLCRMPQEGHAEAYGTPPTRNNNIKPLRKLSGTKSYTAAYVASTCDEGLYLAGRKTKKAEKEGTQAQMNKQVSFLLSTKAHARFLILFIAAVA